MLSQALDLIFKQTKPQTKAPTKTLRESFEYRGLSFTWVKKSYYRNINVKVFEDLEIQLTTGKNPPASFVREFIDKNFDWILESLEYHKKSVGELKEQKILPKPYIGGWVPYLGHAFRILEVEEKKQVRVCLETKSVYLLSPEKEPIAKQLGRLYKKQAVAYISELQKKVSKQMGFEPKKLSFRNQKTRWGSCSSTGAISYNWRLMAAPGAWVEYVIIHETAHLKHMDHSSAFWTWVEKFCPNYPAYVEGLKNKHMIFGFFCENSNLYYAKKNFTLCAQKEHKKSAMLIT